MARRALSRRSRRGLARREPRRSPASRREAPPGRGCRDACCRGVLAPSLRPLWPARRERWRASYGPREATGDLYEVFQGRRGGPVAYGIPSKTHAFFYRLRFARDVDRGAGVEEDDVAGRPTLLAGEDIAKNAGVEVCVAAEQAVWSVAGEAVLFG